MIEVLAPLLVGLLFGFSLHKAGLTHYATIVGIYRLRDMTVLRFMMSALIVGAIGVRAGADLGLAPGGLPVPPTAPLANLVGGVVFGIGMATAGYCPGTIAAECGEGRLDAWIAGTLGLAAGAIGFAVLQPSIMPALARAHALGRVTLADLTGASPWLVVIVFAELAALVLVLVARVGRRTP